MTLESDPTPRYDPPPPAPGTTYVGTNGFAVASLVLGIAGFTVFPFVPSLLALIFGYKGKREIDRSNGQQTGRGLAVAGIVLGWVAIALLILVVLGAFLLLSVSAVRSGGYFPFRR
jgi:predicted metal-binding membrane protein